MKVDLFDYHLPKELIAQTPAEPRDSSKLLVFDRAASRVEHRIFRELDQILTPNDVLVLNQTRVEPRRLFGTKADTGGKLEVLLLEKLKVGSEKLKEENVWECKVSPGLKVGQEVRCQVPGARCQNTEQTFQSAMLEAKVIEITEEGNRLISFNQPVEDVWDKYGVLPIPPYIHDYKGDQELYQTIYAIEDGSLAAPTAGRHFTPELLQRLQAKGVQMEYLTLHVSRDTAFPIIKEEDVEDVCVHSEWVDVPQDVAERLNVAKAEGKRIIAVGTTSVRTLEGVATKASNQVPGARCQITSYRGQVDLFISPGYEFKFVDSIITNFHFPRSSLIMLVAAFAGREKILKVYEEAVQERYRFFSFGDAMFIL